MIKESCQHKNTRTLDIPESLYSLCLMNEIEICLDCGYSIDHKDYRILGLGKIAEDYKNKFDEFTNEIEKIKIKKCKHVRKRYLKSFKKSPQENDFIKDLDEKELENLQISFIRVCLDCGMKKEVHFRQSSPDLLESLNKSKDQTEQSIDKEIVNWKEEKKILKGRVLESSLKLLKRLSNNDKVRQDLCRDIDSSLGLCEDINCDDCLFVIKENMLDFVEIVERANKDFN